MKLIRTDSEDKTFIELVKKLDADLAISDGPEHAFYNQFNKLDLINHVVLAYDKEIAIGCGAIKEYDPSQMEVKRMYTLPEQRGKGIGTFILAELEDWAKELSFKNCIMETGKRQPAAIALYLKNGYEIIENYGQYKGKDNSVCFEKIL